MEVLFGVRTNQEAWGGDMAVINDLVKSINMLGIEARAFNGPMKIRPSTRLVMTNTCHDLRKMSVDFRSKNVPYYVLPFHENFIEYWPYSMGFVRFAASVIFEKEMLGKQWAIEELEETADVFRYAPSITIPRNAYQNRAVLEYSRLSFPSSVREENTIKRDSPRAKTSVIKFPTDTSWKFQGAALAEFTSQYNIPQGYILQVGRLESRKNQLGTILAARNVPIPLVFIATKGYEPWYTNLVLKAIMKFRKHPTYVVSQELEEQQTGNLIVRRMKNSEKLPWSTLESAYLNAGVNCHPAFHELPGLTYIESISLGRPTICSSLTSIDEYLVPPQAGDGIELVHPANLVDIKAALIRSLGGSGPVAAGLIKVSQEGYAREFVKGLL